jgi:hypothetical protein
MTGIRRPNRSRRAHRERRAMDIVRAELQDEFGGLATPEDIDEAVQAAYDEFDWVQRRAYVPRMAGAAARSDLQSRRPVRRGGRVRSRQLVPVGHVRRPHAGPRSHT